MAVKQCLAELSVSTEMTMTVEVAMENIIGVLDDTMDTMHKSEVLRNNLVQQQIEIEKQISLLEGQLQRQKEYLAKIEGGLDVLDELAKK